MIRSLILSAPALLLLPGGLPAHPEKKPSKAAIDDPGNVLADHLEVIVTPTFYVIDRKGVLRYRGAYDENIQEARAQKTFELDALRDVLAGKEVVLKTPRTIGCHMPRVGSGR